MAKKTKTKNSLDVDKGLVAMSLKMSVEERLRVKEGDFSGMDHALFTNNVGPRGFGRSVRHSFLEKNT